MAQGAEGIAVGMACKFLPHNFIELIDQSINHLRGKKVELLPDFPNGGMADFTGYNDGLRGGRVRVRAKIKKVDNKTLTIHEIPFGTTTGSLIESVIKANDKGKIKIRKVVDNTAKDIEIEVREMVTFIGAQASGKSTLAKLISILEDESFRRDDKISFEEELKKYNIISSIKVYNFIEDKSLFNDKLKFVKKTIDSKKNCGVINEDFFCININSIALNSCNNSCLFKKISIDKDGSIKNCPSMSQNFGNIKNTTLDEALKHPDFKKYWNVTKDMIDVCKDCEFRHICTDCRAYVEEPENQYSKPLKCGYNPYTNEWEEWSTNPLKQKAIEYYGMQDLVKRN